MSRYFQYDDERGSDNRYNRSGRSYNGQSHGGQQPSGFMSDMHYDEHYGRGNSDRSYDRRGSGGVSMSEKGSNTLVFQNRSLNIFVACKSICNCKGRASSPAHPTQPAPLWPNFFPPFPSRVTVLV